MTSRLVAGVKQKQKALNGGIKVLYDFAIVGGGIVGFINRFLWPCTTDSQMQKSFVI